MMMVRYEIKKVLGKPSGKIAVFLFVCVVVLACWITASGEEFGPIIWVDETGQEQSGYNAYQALRDAQKKWSGELDEIHLSEIIRELNRIAATPEAKSSDYHKNNIAFHWGLSVKPVRHLLYRTYSSGLQDFDYYIADTLSPSVAGEFYNRRIALFRNYLYHSSSDEASSLSEREKEYLMNQIKKLDTPMLYDYKEGWNQVLQNLGYILLMGTLIMGYLVSGIFSNEFRWKSDAVFFASAHGRGKAIVAKIEAAFLLTTGLYWGGVLFFTLFTLCFCGFDGGNCPIQFDFFRSAYNLTYAETWLYHTFSGYIGILFMMFSCMWVSEKTRSSGFAVTIPFILIFMPNFLEGSSLYYAARGVLGLLPDKLLSLSHLLKYFDVFDLGFVVTGAWPLLFVLYSILTALLVPVMYQEFRKKQIV